jgi:hypothetical protein
MSTYQITHIGNQVLEYHQMYFMNRGLYQNIQMALYARCYIWLNRLWKAMYEVCGPFIQKALIAEPP